MTDQADALAGKKYSLVTLQAHNEHQADCPHCADIERSRVDFAEEIAKWKDSWSIAREAEERWMQKFYALTSENERLKGPLKNLLAVIHHDGGHYTEAHGIEQACAEAETVVVNDRARAEQAEGERDDAKADAEHYRIEASSAYLAVENAQETLATLTSENERLKGKLSELSEKFIQQRALLRAFETESFERAVEVRVEYYHDEACSFRTRAEQAEGKYRLASAVINRLPMCPDHRDKFDPDHCQACRAEKAEAAMLRVMPIVHGPDTSTFCEYRSYSDRTLFTYCSACERVRAALAKVREENTRLAKEHQQVHDWNMKLVGEHYDLGDRIRALTSENERLKGECRERQESFDLLVSTSYKIKTDLDKAKATLARVTAGLTIRYVPGCDAGDAEFMKGYNACVADILAHLALPKTEGEK